jgi:hypothetical protein
LRYQPPWGISDPNAPYINGDPARGVEGSIPPAAAFEYPMKEIVGVIEKSGNITTDEDLLQLAKSVRSQTMNYAEDTGTPDRLRVDYDPPITRYDRGLTLHVRVRYTNTGPASINAGPGPVRISKMNTGDVGQYELSAGAVVTLIFDGTSFQLANFGGGSSTVDSIVVNVPYANDTSTTDGFIDVTFPGVTQELVQGDIIAVKVARTTLGETTMRIDIAGTVVPYNLLPNGGGEMLQGDIAAGDVVQFFYDAANLRFPPNPEINARVDYVINPASGTNYPTFAAAIDALKRKTIGANGYVTLTHVPGRITGPIVINHPSSDRMCIAGTRGTRDPPRGKVDFARSGNTAAARAQDAQIDLLMLRDCYATEIMIPNTGIEGDFGITNGGPGTVLVKDLLITGDQLPFVSGQTYWTQTGVSIGQGRGMNLNNVAVWGSQVGFNNAGAMYVTKCWASANSHFGIGASGSNFWADGCGAFSNQNYGFVSTFGSAWMRFCEAECNAGYGIFCDNGGGMACWWNEAARNGSYDLGAQISSSMTYITPGFLVGYQTTNPPVNTPDMYNALVAIVRIPRPPVPPDP